MSRAALAKVEGKSPRTVEVNPGLPFKLRTGVFRSWYIYHVQWLLGVVKNTTTTQLLLTLAAAVLLADKTYAHPITGAASGDCVWRARVPASRSARTRTLQPVGD